MTGTAPRATGRLDDVPELPEVEVVRRGLAAHVLHRPIARVEVLHPRSVRRHVPGADDFTAALIGQRFRAVCRRGKYLWLRISDSEALMAHLGMSGQLLVQPARATDEKHLRVRFSFSDGEAQLRFVDQRTFGGMSLEPLVLTATGPVPAPVAHIALDPMDRCFDLAATAEAMRTRRTEVKRALLDQTLVSGIGNIYADEALWLARLHGARPTVALSVRKAREVLRAARQVMSAALDAGGTSFDALYVNVNGQSGYFDRSLSVYRQDGRPCPRCGAPIRREPFANRSSYSCPRCQQRARVVRSRRCGLSSA